MLEQEKWQLRDRTARQSGLALDEVPLAMAKPFEGRTARVSKGRRHRLAAYLAAVLTQSADASVVEAEAKEPPPKPHPFGAVCGACRGHCCRNGGDHAYLKAEDLARWRNLHPGADLTSLALTFVPERSYAGSCIFHTSSGCALPWELRSRVCRRYFCEALTSLDARTGEASPAAAVIAFERWPGQWRAVIWRASPDGGGTGMRTRAPRG